MLCKAQKQPYFVRSMYNRQFHSSSNKTSREAFKLPSMTEPDNAMSIPEIIARYMRGHGLAVQVLPESSDQSAREDGQDFVDDVDMFSEERQAAVKAAEEARKAAEKAEPADSPEKS